MRFTLRQLSYFIAAGEELSITLASERVHISQPSISSAISTLEQEFGLQLFFRHHAQGLSLTPAGERMLAVARDLVRQARTLNDLADEINGSVAGPLRIGAFRTLAPLLFPELCVEFSAEYPKVDLSMIEGDEGELAARVRRAEIEVAITYEQRIDDLAFEELATLPTYVLLPARHGLANSGSLRLSDLAGQPFILLDLPVSRDYFRALFEQRGLPINIVARSEQPETVRSFVGSGFGFSLMTARPASLRSLNGRDLRYLPLEDDIPPMRLGMITSKVIRKSRATLAFEEFCRAHISTDHLPGMAQL